jgi:hypothetical protein
MARQYAWIKLHVFPATDTYSYAEAIERSLVDDGVD